MRDLFPQVMFNADTNNGGGGDNTKTTETTEVTTETASDGQDTIGGQDTTTDANESTALTKEDIEKMIQSATDRVRTDYAKKLKDKEKELEETKKSQMSEQERQEYELNQMKDSLSKREKELMEKELTIKTIDLLKEKALPLEAKSFLIGSDEEATVKNIDNFKTMFDSAVEAVVQERFKGSGKSHEQGDGSTVRYTQEMVAKMTPSEINANWEQIQKDLSK